MLQRAASSPFPQSPEVDERNFDSTASAATTPTFAELLQQLEAAHWSDLAELREKLQVGFYDIAGFTDAASAKLANASLAVSPCMARQPSPPSGLPPTLVDSARVRPTVRHELPCSSTATANKYSMVLQSEARHPSTPSLPSSTMAESVPQRPIARQESQCEPTDPEHLDLYQNMKGARTMDLLQSITSTKTVGISKSVDSQSVNRKVLQPLFREHASIHWQEHLQEQLQRHRLGSATRRQGHGPEDPNMGNWIRKLEVVATILIILNTAFIGWQVHHRAVHHTHSVLDTIGGVIFCLAFSIDLFVRGRLLGFRIFLHGANRWWNWFDACVVALMVFEELLRVVASSLSHQLFVLRVFRLIHFMRLFYILRAVAAFREFALTIRKMLCACRAVFSMLAVIMYVLYVVAVCLTEGTHETCQKAHLVDTVALHERSAMLCDRFGRLDNSMLNLYQAMFGGILWGDLLGALQTVDFVYSIVFVAFISFIFIVASNTVIAVIIDMQAEAARSPQVRLRETERHIEQLCAVFEKIDVNGSGDMHRRDWENALKDKHTLARLAALELDFHNAQDAFDLLDRDGTGVVDQTEFVLGCLNLQGDAKTLDVKKLQADNASLQHQVTQIQQTVRAVVGSLNVHPDVLALSSMSGECDGNLVSRPSDEVWQKSPLAATDGLANKPQQTISRRLRKHTLRSKGCSITKTEERAMSLKELCALRRRVQKICEEEGWKDQTTGHALQAEEVDLYHLNYYHICPTTTLKGSILHGLSPPAAWQTGQRVEQRHADSCQAASLAEGQVEEVDQNGNVQVSVLRGRFMPGVPVSVDGTDLGKPSEIFTPDAVSYKELIATGPLRPRWFCCHWWGEPVLNFIACCESHAEKYAPSDTSFSFWICAYANCQHDLGVDITCDPENSSFRRAMKLAEGVLLVLDADATPFRRIWCDFELYKTIAVDKKPLGIVTMHDGRPRLLSEKCLPNETLHYKNLREQQFPCHLLVEGMRLRLEDGDASIGEDKKNILKRMAMDANSGSSNEDRLTLVLQQANAALHAYFSLAAWSSAVNEGVVEDFDRQRLGTISLPEVLVQDTLRQSLTLSLAYSSYIHDRDLLVLARGLPPNLVELCLTFASCPNITDAGVHALSSSLPTNLQRLVLDLSSCPEVTDKALEWLSEELPRGLQELELCMAYCGEITSRGVSALAANLPTGLTTLTVMLRGTEVDKVFDSPAALQRFVSGQGSLSAMVGPFALSGWAT